MIDKLSVSRPITKSIITGVSYLRGYIRLKKSQNVVEASQDRISTKYFDQLFYKNYINENIISSLRPNIDPKRVDNLSYFSTLQGLMNKLQMHQTKEQGHQAYFRVIQEELNLHQEVFYKRLQESAV